MLSDALVVLEWTAYLAGLELSSHLAAFCSYTPKEETGRDLHLPHNSAARAAREIMLLISIRNQLFLLPQLF